MPKLASCLQIADFSECAPNFGTPQDSQARELAVPRPLSPTPRDGDAGGRPGVPLDRLGLGRRLDRLDEGLHALLRLGALSALDNPAVARPDRAARREAGRVVAQAIRKGPIIVETLADTATALETVVAFPPEGDRPRAETIDRGAGLDVDARACRRAARGREDHRADVEAETNAPAGAYAPFRTGNPCGRIRGVDCPGPRASCRDAAEPAHHGPVRNDMRRAPT